MNIYSPEGTKVKVQNLSKIVASFGGNTNPQGILEIGKEYTVLETIVHSQHTKVVLQEYPQYHFNSCHFE